MLYYSYCQYCGALDFREDSDEILYECIFCGTQSPLINLPKEQDDDFFEKLIREEFEKTGQKLTPEQIVEKMYKVSQNPKYKGSNYHNHSAQRATTQQTSQPKCPTCGSTNIKKLDTFDRAVSVGLFGIFSKKINKSFECRNCKYTW